MNYVTLDWQGKSIRVPAVKNQGRLWFHWQGETHVIDLNPGRRAGGGSAKADPGMILAPMPGKVTQTRVKKDEQVKKGQALVVMEAMKMEYTLEADVDGQVLELNAQTGAQVELGQLLVRVGTK